MNIIQSTSALEYVNDTNPFGTLFYSLSETQDTSTIELKIKLLTNIIRTIEEIENKSENENNIFNWLSIISGISGTAIIITAASLNPLLAVSTTVFGVGSTLATIGGSVLKIQKESPVVNQLKKYRLCLSSAKTSDWAAIWHLIGTEKFIDSLYEGATGQIFASSLVRRSPSLNSVIDYVASCGGVSSQELIEELKKIKNGRKPSLKLLSSSTNEEHSDNSKTDVCDSTVTKSTFNNVDFFQNSLVVSQHLIENASKSRLPGCVILAAPGSGKTTFLGSVWLKLKQKYSGNFKSLAIIVKPEDKVTFEKISNKVINAKTQSRKAAVEIIKFVAEGMRKSSEIRRLFLDDFLTASKYLNAAVKGYQINLETFATYSSKKEAESCNDFDTISMKDAYESALNEAWLVGREYNLCLWVSSHSSNIEDLSFITSSSTRSVGDFIFLAKDGKRDFLEGALKNDSLVPSYDKRVELKQMLGNLKVNSQEPIMLANLENWILGVVPNSIRAEYESLLSETTNVNTSTQETKIQAQNTVIQSQQNIVSNDDTTITIDSEELNKDFKARQLNISIDALVVFEKLDKFNGDSFTPRDVVRMKPFGKIGDNSTSKIKYYLEELAIAKLLNCHGEKYSVVS